MKTVWKFILQTRIQTLEMPVGALILSAKEQHDYPTLWALVDTEAEKEKRTFVIVGTGHPIEQYPGELSFIDTIKVDGGALIFHVFEGVGHQNP